MKPIFIRASLRGESLEQLIAERNDSEALLSRLPELITFGAIYIEDQRCNDEFSAKSPLKSECLIRIYPEPKRFPMENMDRPGFVLKESEHLLAVKKPSGVPSLPVASNQIENCKFEAEALSNRPLYPIHRLDEDTCGVLVFAKNPTTVKRFHQDLRSGSVLREYLGWSKNPMPLGVISHKMQKIPGRMEALDPSNNEGQLAQLEVLSSNQMASSGIFEHRIRLITGRTHQIRCQMQALGNPLMGDPIYGSQSDSSKAERKSLYLLARKFQWGDFNVEVETADFSWLPVA